jgi:hypothetical protein
VTEFLRAGSIPIRRSVEGNGHRIVTDAYPFQGLSLPRDGYPTDAEPRRSLVAKHGTAVTPLTTSVVELVRVDETGVLASKCGYCQEYLSKGKCRCHAGPTANVDDSATAPPDVSLYR